MSEDEKSNKLPYEDDPAFEVGYAVGVGVGEYQAYREAQAAWDMGEIQLWLDYQRPKSFEEWTEWFELRGTTHSEMRTRWIQ